MTPKHFIAGIVLAAISVTASAALAKEKHGHKGHHMSFEALDADADGQITRAEMEAAAKARFDSVDANGDGALSRDELLASAQARAEKRVDRMMQRHDTDGDGVLSADEHPGPREGMFDRADADGSGGISKEEFAEMRKHGRKHKAQNHKAKN